MNPKESTSPRATTRLTDEPDDPGPSTSGDLRAAAPRHSQPVLHIAGEAARDIDVAWFTEHLTKVIALMRTPVRAINLELVHDERMRALHGRHLDNTDSTDVLTFPTSDAGEPIEADIVLCVDEARWRADQFDHAVERELLLYALHGMLHCAGYDDHDEAGFAAMHNEEDRILEAIGVGRTFWAEAAGSGATAQDAVYVDPAEHDKQISGRAREGVEASRRGFHD